MTDFFVLAGISGIVYFFVKELIIDDPFMKGGFTLIISLLIFCIYYVLNNGLLN